MKPTLFRVLAIQALLAASLTHALPSHAAGLAAAIHRSMPFKAYVSPGIGALLQALWSLLLP